jgi:DNA-binding NarL/FixJ family response regulator
MTDSKPYALVAADFMFGARIASALEGQGWASTLVGSLGAALDAAKKRVPEVLIAELGANGWEKVEGIRQFKADAQTSGIPILAFGSHKSRSLLEEARAAGADLVVSNGVLVSQFDALLRRISDRRWENHVLAEESDE